VESHQAVLVSFPVASIDRRIHAHGYSPVLSVFWATVFSFATSFLHRDCALFSYDLFRGREPLAKGIFGSKFFKALEAGSTGCSMSPPPAPAQASSSAW